MKRLIVDTNVLVGELSRASGWQRLKDSRLDLYTPGHMRDEAVVEIPRRVVAFARARSLFSTAADDIADECLDVFKDNVTFIEPDAYSAYEDEARARSQRDPSAWPVVACALTLKADIGCVSNSPTKSAEPVFHPSIKEVAPMTLTDSTTRQRFPLRGSGCGRC